MIELVRSFTVVEVEQKSPEWFAARCGKVTGSQAGDMLSKVKTGEAAARRDLRTKLALERLTGVPQEDGYVNADMKRGAELEDAALAAYEAATGVLVERVGFVQHVSLAAGHSPDGILDDFDGLLELKAPRSATHLRYLRGKTMPAEHIAQVTHGLFVTGAQYCDFASFDPRFPEPLRLFKVRVLRSDVDLAAYELVLRVFLTEVEREVEEVSALVSAA